MRIGLPTFVNKKERIEEVYACISARRSQQTDIRFILLTYQSISPGKDNESIIPLPILLHQYGNIVPF
jgi:hypothetical protein